MPVLFLEIFSLVGCFIIGLCMLGSATKLLGSVMSFKGDITTLGQQMVRLWLVFQFTVGISMCLYPFVYLFRHLFA